MTAEFGIEVDVQRVARYLFWRRLWFLLLKWGARLARQQAQRLHYWLEAGTLRVDQGLWWYQRKAIPLSRITDLNLRQNPVERLFGIWSLSVETAGHSGRYPAEAHLIGHREPERVRDALLEAIKEATELNQGGDSSS